jgi:hypothetical protein
MDPGSVGQCETFYVQQMRRRLWLTICVLDIQLSFGLSSQPLIPAEEAMCSDQAPSHINDADFGPTTDHPVQDREGLTDITYALMKYKLQLAGRLINFGTSNTSSTDDSKGFSTTSSSPAHGMPPQTERKKHADRFEQEVLQLLHFCKPESSTYAWFTFHAAQGLVAALQSSILRPFQRLAEPVPRSQGDTRMLRLCCQALEKSVLMHTDPRGEGFRWNVTIPWHSVALALVECYVCQDEELVRQVWPTIEASYKLHEAALLRAERGGLQGPLGKLMKRTREKLQPMLQQSHDALSYAPAMYSQSAGTAPSVLPLEQRASRLALSSDSQQFSTMDNVAGVQGDCEMGWNLWDEFLSDLPVDDFASADLSFIQLK